MPDEDWRGTWYEKYVEYPEFFFLIVTILGYAYMIKHGWGITSNVA
jgi:hypothetical protein